MLAKLGKRAWLHCDGCRHSIMIEPHELAQRHRLDMLTPLLTISKAMRCTRCGARKGCCWPEPHNTRGEVKCRGGPVKPPLRASTDLGVCDARKQK